MDQRIKERFREIIRERAPRPGRVLKPGGLMLIGVHGFVTLPSDTGASTQTYKIHHSVDYYRFSLAAVTEVFFDDMRDVQVETMLSPPRIVASGLKPWGVV